MKVTAAWFLFTNIVPQQSHSLPRNAMSASEDASASKPAALSKLEDIRDALRNFAEERDWHQYHTPRNLLLALVGEVGELSEIFQWKGEVSRGMPELNAKERAHAAEEMSDVLLYLVRLSDVCGIDLSAAVADKLRKNAIKYPAQQCRGSSAKYTELKGMGGPALSPSKAPGKLAAAPLDGSAQEVAPPDAEASLAEWN